jgi:hypothetical protein
VCRLCAVSDRECSYPSQAQDERPVGPALSSREQAIEARIRGKTVNKYSVDLPRTPSFNTSSLGHPVGPLHCTHYDASSDAVINLDHMELLIHITQDSDIFNLGTGVESYRASGLALGLREAQRAPYLMHAILAFSAQHLAYLHPGGSKHYLSQAVSLQTRAITLFNTAWTDVDASNCVAILLFSSILGHHLLAETLTKRDSDDLDAFIERYVQCVNMQRGIYVIAESAWPLLMETELEPILSMSHYFTSRDPVGNECWSLHDLIDGSHCLSDEEEDATRTAIKYMQIGFDASEAEMEPSHNRHQMIYSWTMLLRPDFTTMLVRRQPEALILLAYYAVLLHRGKTLWQVGDAGTYIFKLVAQYLGKGWDQWLGYPRECILGVGLS